MGVGHLSLGAQILAFIIFGVAWMFGSMNLADRLLAKRLPEPINWIVVLVTLIQIATVLMLGALYVSPV